MKSKKRHHGSSDESQESNISDKSSSSSDSESEDSSESDHRYKKKRKHADSSDSESNSDDQKRSKKRKHKKKKKKHGKKKRRSESVISCDNFSISDGEIASKKKKKHKHKSKRARTSTVSEDEEQVPRRLHSVVKERRPSSGDGSQPSRTYYHKRVNRVSGQQLEMLWEFLNTNRDIATAYNRSLQAKEYAQRKWREIAELLNSHGNGTHKDWKRWSKYWVDYKGKLKARVAAVRSSHVQPGGGPSTDKPLTEIEVKFLQILGEDFGQSLPGLRVEPFPEPQELSTGPVLMEVKISPHSESILQCIKNPLSLSPIPSLPTEPSQEALPQTPYLAHSSCKNSIISVNPPLPSRNHSPLRRRHRREPPMAPEAARRALVASSQMRAEAAVRTADAMEAIAAKITELQKTAKNIERREYRRSASVENYDREQEVQRFYRGSSKEHKYPQENYNYERQRNDNIQHPSEKYDRYREKFDPNRRFNNSNPEHGYRQREYVDFKRPRYEERRPEEHFNKRPREETYYREDPRANTRYNQYDVPKRREFSDNRDFRDRRAPPEPARYREREFVNKREKPQEERFSPERNRDMRRERPARLDKPHVPHPREPSKSPEMNLKDRNRRGVGEEREERDERSRARYPRDERDDRKERPLGDDKPRERKSRFTDADENKEYNWGKVDVKKEGKGGPGDKEKPNFGLSGKLTADANTVNGVVLKYTEPDDAKQPKRRWRFYPFKGDKALPILYIHRQSCFLLGRDKACADIPLEHPSVSKQHAALQYRATPFTRADGTQGRRVRPYIIDLDSANGTFVNNKKVEPRRYVELLERDVVKFGFSQREYVLLHENSKDDAQDDDQPVTSTTAVTTTDQVRRDKRVKEEIAADGD